jgi:hypothetical protein
MTSLKIRAGAGLGALAIGFSVLAAPAQAKPKFYPKPYGYYHHGYGYGYGAPLAAGIVGALALGTVAAAAASEPSCYVEERERMDRFGNIYVRQVRVCD